MSGPAGDTAAAAAPSAGGAGGFDLVRRATQAMMSRYVTLRHCAPHSSSRHHLPSRPKHPLLCSFCLVRQSVFSLGHWPCIRAAVLRHASFWTAAAITLPSQSGGGGFLRASRRPHQFSRNPLPIRIPPTEAALGYLNLGGGRGPTDGICCEISVLPPIHPLEPSLCLALPCFGCHRLVESAAPSSQVVPVSLMALEALSAGGRLRPPEAP
ncbi:hypothetical protein B0T26DRAFT_688280 [Lasiosphaeria miniovina]|uniref:Uncharacterized protein n=1 Tax=Lasiosphaeria miniovina TaxID=1954250 RepID=A0AA40BHM0_9PEZI|nr:uncharacterized protein B0T26DRAFT_688280 [Lasiosphaeria miniovina]KAK0734385.1 hypothetical protein B0T26DRAFT_688280 [Lasiosphaeria miniovina]